VKMGLTVSSSSSLEHRDEHGLYVALNDRGWRLVTAVTMNSGIPNDNSRFLKLLLDALFTHF